MKIPKNGLWIFVCFNRTISGLQNGYGETIYTVFNTIYT